MRAVASAKLANTPDHQQNGGRNLELMPYLFLFIGITIHRRGLGVLCKLSPVPFWCTPDCTFWGFSSIFSSSIDTDQPPMEEAFRSGHCSNALHQKRKIDPPRPLLFRQQRLIDGEPPFLGINRLRQKRHRRSQVVGLLTGHRPPKQEARSHLD